LEAIIVHLRGLGIRVSPVDTLSLLTDDMTSLDALVEAWTEELRGVPTPDLVIGNGLGGTLVQAMLPQLGATAAGLISSPTRIDPALASALASIIDPAERGELTRAMQRLHELVTPAGEPTRTLATVPDDPVASWRLARGLNLLRDPGLDLSKSVRSHNGPLLAITGSLSRMVSAANVVVGERHDLVVVRGSGMRPHVDQPELVNRLFTELLRRGDRR
jgi:pimeloyl-ACP methyl ester carboxylesterase